jgi:uncharacterized DUF497 family protein
MLPFGCVFEFDPDKSRTNQAKHGLGFLEAQELWAGPTVEAPLTWASEERSLVVGLIAGKFWSAIITRRNEKIRIISVRRSREAEILAWQRHHHEP